MCALNHINYLFCHLFNTFWFYHKFQLLFK